MNEVARVFESCRRDRRAAFVPYLMAGDPDIDRGTALLHALVAGGADCVGIGVAFTDPIADGPVVQRATLRALEGGGTLSAVLDMVARNREALGVPVVLFTYFNPVHARGLETFAEQAATSGVDAVLCVDLPPEEGERELGPALAAQGVDLGYMLAPDSPRQRVRVVKEASRGFVFCVSRGGVTGLTRRLPDYVLKQTKRLRRRLDLPMAAGFGVSTPKQVEQVAKVADGVVAGSVLVRTVERNLAEPDLARCLEEKARELRAAVG